MLFIGSCSIDIPPNIEVELSKLSTKVDYNFDVKPILSDRCYSCHGPDENARKSDLRLDLEKMAKGKLVSGNGRAINEGNPAKSELVKRIFSEDPEYLMPTPDSHLQLTDKERAILYQWIKDGAPWKNHWSFDVPKKGLLPPPHDNWTNNNEIDQYIHANLVETRLSPSIKASKERLIRRVSLDLTGLPPTIQEIDDYLNDSSQGAYEKVVDRLLSSDACAERLTMEWLDVSRYADSHGMHADGYRYMWPWRDWVIDAFHRNMPYDQFVTWQIAGDLLPEASKDQILATAFNRNHTMTAEGGVIDEEFRLSYVFDRTETITTVLQGLTLNCARCHDHKFDPISQKDYYAMNAFFNNVKELGMTGDDGNYGPMLQLPDPKTEEDLKQINLQIEKLEERVNISIKDAIDKAQFMKNGPARTLKDNLEIHAPFDIIQEHHASDKKKVVVDNNARITGNVKNQLVEGKFGKALIFTGEYDEVYLQDVPNYEKYDPFSVSLWIKTFKRDSAKTQTLVCTSGDKNNFWRGWEFEMDDKNRLNVRLIHSLPHNYLHVQSRDSIKVNTWTHVGFTYDGSEKAEGVEIYIDGKVVETKVRFDKLYKSIKPVSFVSAGEKSDAQKSAAYENPELAFKLVNRPVKVAKSNRGFTGESGVFKGAIDDINIFNAELSESEIKWLNRPHEDQKQKDFDKPFNTEIENIQSELFTLRRHRHEILKGIPEIMVMSEMNEDRPMYVYHRGDYSQPRDLVNPDVPKILPPFQDEFPKNRLGLSRWFFSNQNPLTARVTVNRYWQMIFGRGLVSTPQDFGYQGALPSHPELLDWLAVDLMENGWDIKRLLRQIVTSATYQQSSEIKETHLQLDPENILLSRGPSYRLPAEMIRDNALAASGLLIMEPGGPSVRPYQPEGLWIEKSFFSQILLRYQQSKDSDLYRRSMYTFIRRTAPPPSMTVFDQPNREVCIVKRENTSTPLQALVLMNDPQFVEAARILAERIQIEGGPKLEDQLILAFRLTTGRKPSEEEHLIFKNLYFDQLRTFENDRTQTEKLFTVGEALLDPTLNKEKTAALAMVASTMINHNEAYMKR